jgi:predicted dehydrogenase
MPKSPLKIAIVGAGLIGRKHAQVVADHAHLHALIDPNPEAKEIAAQFGALWFDTLDAYLTQHQPDGVIVATPNQLHSAHATACLNKRVPTLVEKPLADTQTAGRDIIAASKQNDTPVLVGHHRRHSPVIKAAKQAIEDCALGQIVTVQAQFWLFKPDDYFDVDWRRKAGAGPTFINLIHDVDLLRHFCGDISRVHAVESNAVRGFEVEDTSAVILQFASGVLGTLSISDTVVAPWSWELTAGENPAYPKTDQSAYMLGGTKGGLSVPDLGLWQHTTKRSWWEPIERTSLPVTAADPVAEQFLHFLDVIEGTATPLVSAQDGLKNILVLEAIKTAAATGLAQTIAPS